MTHDKSQVEQGKHVRQLVRHISFFFSGLRIGADKIAGNQVFQYRTQFTAGQMSGGGDILSAQAHDLFGKRFNDSAVICAFFEQGTKEKIELSSQWGVFGKEQPVDIDGKRQLGIQHIQIIGDAAHDHIDIQNLLSGVIHFLDVVQKFLCLPEGEGREVYGSADSAI